MDTDNDGQQQTEEYYAECLEFIEQVNAQITEFFLKAEAENEHLPADK